jgi:hypothetical protein
VTYDDAVTVTGMVINAFPGDREWNAAQITMYAKGIQHLDAEVATKAVLQAQKTMPRRPDVAALISISRSISAGTARGLPIVPVRKPKPMPGWVKEWVYARFHVSPPDMRVFAEQREWADPDDPLMPPGEYAIEAQHLSDHDVIKAVAP